MRTLVMDTSTKYLVIGLYEDGNLIDGYMHYGQMRQSEDAIPALKRILDLHQWSLKSLDEMVVTRGPGSYTGVRVALTIAKTLAAISDIRIKTVSSLQAFVGLGSGIAVIDARSEKVFVCAYQNGRPLIEEKMIHRDEFEDFCQSFSCQDVYGDPELVSREPKKVLLYQTIYDLSCYQEAILDVDFLVPTYIKDVMIR